MQVNNLNKTINLLIIGSFALLNICLLDIWLYSSQHLNSIISFLKKNELEDFQTLIGLFSVPLIIFLGIVINTLAEMIREFIGERSSRYKKRRSVAAFFRNANDYDRYIFWKTSLLDKLGSEFKEHASYNGVGTTIFFEKSKEASINWVVSHYITYIMAADFAMILTVDFFYFLFFEQWLTALFTALLIWILLCQSVGKFFYSYSFLFRFSSLYASSFFDRYEQGNLQDKIEDKQEESE